MSVDLRTPWRIDPTKYGVMVDCDGNRVCMAFTRQDADAIVAAMNATHRAECTRCGGVCGEPLDRCAPAKHPFVFAVGDRVEVFGKASKEWHPAVVVRMADVGVVAQLTDPDATGEILIRDMKDAEDRGCIRHAEGKRMVPRRGTTCRACSKPMTPTPANDPEPDVCSSCAEAGELSGDSGGFGVETIGGGTEWFGTLDEAWSAMGPGRRVVTHG